MKALFVIAFTLPTLSSSFVPTQPIKTVVSRHQSLVSTRSQIFVIKPTMEKQDNQQLSTSDTKAEQTFEEPHDTEQTFLQRMKSRASSVFHRSKKEDTEQVGTDNKSLGIFVPSQFASREEVSTETQVSAPKSDLSPATPELSEEKQLLQKVKDAGIAGVISYASWEIAFWAVSVPVVLFGYYEFTGHWPDLSNKEDIATLSAEAFAFVNFARFAVPLRIGLALSTTPWIQSNIVDKFMKDKKEEN